MTTGWDPAGALEKTVFTALETAWSNGRTGGNGGGGAAAVAWAGGVVLGAAALSGPDCAQANSATAIVVICSAKQARRKTVGSSARLVTIVAKIGFVFIGKRSHLCGL